MKKEYLNAQNQHTLGFGEQVMHVKRLWVILIGLFAYLLSGSYFFSAMFFLLLLYLSIRMLVLDIRQKEGLLHYLFAYYVSKSVVWLIQRLSRLVRFIMHACLLFTSLAFAQIEPPPRKEEIPPPPPAPPPPPPQVSSAEAKVEPITVQEVEAIIRRENIRTFVQEGQYYLAPGGHAKMPLRENNVVGFHETMPVILVFDKEIKDVFILSSISAFYDEKSIFLLGPTQVYGGFAVSFKDGTYAYFTLVKQTDFSLSGFRKEDKKLDQFLQKGKNYPPPPVRKLITFYYFYTPRVLPLYQVVQAYIKSRTTCPQEGFFTYEGVLYKVIRIGREGVLRDEGDFFACGYYWRIER